ncbi:hypothetical protein [uncultured Sphingomonas sp.]|uniref:hypothetical protein n=1 Tax=uncultured Sphingomonas sp. TaxID=158754 RepID=UPI0037483BC2
MGWPLVLVGVLGCGPLAVPCEPLPPKHLPLIERQFDYAATMPAALRTRATALNTLQLQDRVTIRRNQSDELRLDGPIDLTLSAVRISGGPADSAGVLRSDRYTMLSLGASAAVEFGAVHLRANVANASVRRRRDVLPTAERRLSADVTSAGLEASYDGGPALGVDYLRIGTSRGRQLFAGPEVVNVGGVSAGHGLRLTLSDDQLTETGVTMGWRVSLSSLRRPLADGRLGGADCTDAQAEARWTITFR